MRITTELLKKYVRGECTPTEKTAVEEWLDSTKDEAQNLPDQSLKRMTHEIWYTLPVNKTKRRWSVHAKQVYRYAVAACIAGIGIIGIYQLDACVFRTQSESLVTDNTHQASVKYLQTSMANYALLPGSKLAVTQDLCKPQLNIHYYGNSQIENTSNHVIELVFQFNGHKNSGLKALTLKPKGKCTFFTSSSGKNYIVKNNNWYTMSPSDWQNYRRLFVNV